MNIFRNSLIMVFGGGITTLLSAVQGIVVARLLGPTGIGQFQLAITLSLVISTLLIFGIGQANIYFLNQLKKELYIIFSNSILFSVIAGIIAVVSALLIFRFGDEYTGNFKQLTEILFSFSLFFIILQAILGQILVSQMRVKAFNAIQVAVRTGIIILICVLAWIIGVSVDLAIIIIAISQVVTACWFYFMIKNRISSTLAIDLPLLWQTFKYGIKLHTVSLLTTLDQNIGVILISYHMPGEFDEIGFYSRAMAICALFRVIPLSLQNFLYSHWSGLNEQSRTRQMENVLKMYFYFGIALVIAVFIFGKYVIWGMYGKAFLPAYPVLLMLSIQQVLWLITKVLQPFCFSSGKPSLITYNLIAVTSLSVVTMFYMIPKFGIVGAAYSLLIGHTFGVFINALIAKKVYGINLYHCILINKEDIVLLLRKLNVRKSLIG